MALRGTLTHRKIRRLASLLGIPACFALGLAESLWHVAGEQTIPSGAVGKMSNKDIAMEMFYEGDADQLIWALTEAVLIDASSECRLIVHDWHVHSDDATDNKLSRMGQRYANGEMPRMRRLSRLDREKACAHFTTPCAQMRTDAHTIAQNATECHEMPLPAPVPDPEPVKEQKQNPSRGKPERKSDERHMEFKTAVKTYWDSKNPDHEMPWGPAEGKQLGMFLREAPHITIEQFTGFLRARFKSQVNHGDRPCQWLKWVTSFGNGPIDRFNKPIEEDENGNTRQTGAIRAGNGSPAHERVTRGLSALGEALAKRGLEEFRAVPGGGSEEMAQPGHERLSGGLFTGFRETGEQALDYGCDSGDGRVKNPPRPSILPPARRDS